MGLPVLLRLERGMAESACMQTILVVAMRMEFGPHTLALIALACIVEFHSKAVPLVRRVRDAVMKGSSWGWPHP